MKNRISSERTSGNFCAEEVSENMIRKFLTNCFLLFNSKGKKVDVDEYRTISIDGLEINPHISSNIVYEFELENKKYFFRECTKRSNLTTEIMSAIDGFFLFVANQDSDEMIYRKISASLSKPDNMKRLLKVRDIYNANVFAFRGKTFHQFALIGLEFFDRTEWKWKYKFCKYLKGVIGTHIANRFSFGSNYNMFFANRQLATYELSKLLGVDYLIPKVELVNLNYKGKTFFGTLMAAAGEVSPVRLTVKERQNVSENFFKQLCNLEIFDFICYQLDHRLGNLNVSCADGVIDRVYSFDNDARWTFSCNPRLPKKTYFGTTAPVESGKIFAYYKDTPFFDNIGRLSKKSKEDIRLKRYLNPLQIYAIHIRSSAFCKGDITTAVIKENSYISYFLSADEMANSIKSIGIELD